MPSRVWSHLCDYASVDGNGKAMIIGELDHIFAANLPLQYPLFFVVVKWAGTDQETFTHKVRIIDTHGQPIVESQQQTPVIQGKGRSEGYFTTIDAFMLTIFEQFGDYFAEILVNDFPVHILPLHIVRVQFPS